MNNGALDFSLFYLDGLHLVEKGKLKLGKSIFQVNPFVIEIFLQVYPLVLVLFIQVKPLVIKKSFRVKLSVQVLIVQFSVVVLEQVNLFEVRFVKVNQLVIVIFIIILFFQSILVSLFYQFQLNRYHLYFTFPFSVFSIL